MKKSILALIISAVALFAAPINQSVKAGDIDVKVSTEKSIASGPCSFKITLSKNSKEIRDASVKLKIWMPEMPGMPAMGEEVDAKIGADGYVATPSFCMNGGWQVTVTVVEKGQKAKKYRFNVNF